MANDKNTEARFDYVLPTVKAETENGRKRIRATASSDEPDLSGEVMSLKAIQQMRDAFAKNMTVFLNHQYSVPDDVAGRVVSAEIVRRDGFNDLDLTIEIDQNNPRALQAYEQVRGHVALGVSIGCIVKEAKAVTRGGKRLVEIVDLVPLEASLCGIPSNRRSWVSGAYKAAAYVLEKRSAQPKIAAGDAVIALRLEVSLLKALIAVKDGEIARQQSALNELGAAVGALLKTPRGRKLAPLEAFDDLATRYPWLDERVRSELARDAYATGARS